MSTLPTLCITGKLDYMTLLLTIDIFNLKRNVRSALIEHSEKRNGLYLVTSLSSCRYFAMINWSWPEQFMAFP